MDNILFSVVVPIYNCDNYLKNCVDSIIQQSYKKIELILVDDGSTDHSPKICDKYQQMDSRIKVIHKQNGGLVSARQAGAVIAKGEYIICVDSDDWVENDYIEQFARIVKKYSPDIIVSGMILSCENKHIHKILPYRKGYYSKNNIKKEIFPLLIQDNNASYFAPTLAAKAIKRELYTLNQRPIDYRIKIGEDGACVIPCVYNANSMFILSYCGYHYRQNIYSMTKENKAFDWDGPRLIAEHLKNQIDLNQFDFRDQLYRKIVHELFTVVVSQFNRNEAYREICNDIYIHLQMPMYKKAISKANFSSVKGKMALFSLRYKWYFCLYSYSLFQHMKKWKYKK